MLHGRILQKDGLTIREDRLRLYCQLNAPFWFWIVNIFDSTKKHEEKLFDEI